MWQWLKTYSEAFLSACLERPDSSTKPSGLPALGFSWHVCSLGLDQTMTDLGTLFLKIKSRSTASTQLSAYAHWLQTHRQILLTGNDTNGQTDGRTDATKYIISLASRSIINNFFNYRLIDFYLLPPPTVGLLWTRNLETSGNLYATIQYDTIHRQSCRIFDNCLGNGKTDGERLVTDT